MKSVAASEDEVKEDIQASITRTLQTTTARTASTSVARQMQNSFAIAERTPHSTTVNVLNDKAHRAFRPRRAKVFRREP